MHIGNGVIIWYHIQVLASFTGTSLADEVRPGIEAIYIHVQVLV